MALFGSRTDSKTSRIKMVVRLNLEIPHSEDPFAGVLHRLNLVIRSHPRMPTGEWSSELLRFDRGFVEPSR
jgi:hypothetical protein